MLRTLSAAGRTAYTCLCGARSQVLADQHLPSQARRWLHTSTTLRVMDKDQRSKRTTIQKTQEDKLEHLRQSEGGTQETPEQDVILGSDQHIALIPDQHTNGMLINGTRFDQLPILHMQCSPNNTMVILTDHTGNKHYGRTSCGKEGFRNAKKSSTVAAQATGMSIGYTAKRKGIEYVRVVVKGIGSGRMPALKGAHMAGVKVVSITDDTPIPVNGPRPRKVRRL